MKFFQWLVTMLFWLQAFVAPVLLFGLMAVLVYGKTKNVAFVIVLLVMGILGGALLAEFIQRRYGLGTFFAAVYGSGKLIKRKNEVR
jgi:hypothetical protein